MSSDAIDLLFDWRDERREEDREDEVVEVGKNKSARKPWPPREVTEEELASVPTRKCRDCGEIYPKTKEFYSWHRAVCIGCERLQNRKKTRRWENRNPLEKRCQSMKGGARKRRIEWGFDNREDLREFWDAPCHYCGGDVPNRIALDRVDNDKGYIPGNVVQCCLTCNQMKAKHSVDEWVAHMKKVLEHLES